MRTASSSKRSRSSSRDHERPLLRWPSVMLACAIVLASMLSVASARSVPPHAAGDEFATRVAPFLEQNCWLCHGATRQRGGIEFDDYAEEHTALADADGGPGGAARPWTASNRVAAGARPGVDGVVAAREAPASAACRSRRGERVDRRPLRPRRGRRRARERSVLGRARRSRRRSRPRDAAPAQPPRVREHDPRSRRRRLRRGARAPGR